jgi:Amidohydrolase family
VRVRCCYEVTDRNGLDGAKAGLAENERFLRAGGDGFVGAHACFTLSDDTLDAVTDLAADLGVGVHLHVAGAEADAGAAGRLVARADQSWLLAHAVHLDRSLPGVVVHNPRSNLNNAVGYGRPVRFARVALGTDGIGADMLEEFRLAFALARSHHLEFAPTDAWKWLENGWHVVPGAVDDRVTWSYEPMDPWHLAYTPGVRPVRVIVDGEVVLDESGPTRVDASEIRARAREAAQRLFSRMAEL